MEKLDAKAVFQFASILCLVRCFGMRKHHYVGCSLLWAKFAMTVDFISFSVEWASSARSA